MLLMDEPFGALDALTRRSMQDELLRIWTELKQTIVFVTHGIEESLVLADRVVVMTYRPGTVKKIIPVTLGRPRDETAPGFSGALRGLTELVREEQKRHERAEQT
jgi:NitT/TauT family transport system ATP-binding protein